MKQFLGLTLVCFLCITHALKSENLAETIGFDIGKECKTNPKNVDPDLCDCIKKSCDFSKCQDPKNNKGWCAQQEKECHKGCLKRIIEQKKIKTQ